MFRATTECTAKNIEQAKACPHRKGSDSEICSYRFDGLFTYCNCSQASLKAACEIVKQADVHTVLNYLLLPR